MTATYEPAGPPDHAAACRRNDPAVAGALDPANCDRCRNLERAIVAAGAKRKNEAARAARIADKEGVIG